jgi:hypothetical protein
MVKKSTSKRANRTILVATDKTYRVLINVGPHETPRNLHPFRLDHCCMPQRPADATGVRWLHAYASGATVRALRKAGRKVSVLADAEKEGKRAQQFVGKGDRFKGGRLGPPGVGKLI